MYSSHSSRSSMRLQGPMEEFTSCSTEAAGEAINSLKSLGDLDMPASVILPSSMSLFALSRLRRDQFRVILSWCQPEHVLALIQALASAVYPSEHKASSTASVIVNAEELFLPLERTSQTLRRVPWLASSQPLHSAVLLGSKRSIVQVNRHQPR